MNSPKSMAEVGGRLFGGRTFVFASRGGADCDCLQPQFYSERVQPGHSDPGGCQFIRLTLVRDKPIFAVLANSGANSTIGRLGNLGREASMFADVGPNLVVKFGPSLVEFCPIWADSSAKIGRHQSKRGRTRPQVVPRWPTLAEIDKMLANIVPHLTRSKPTLADSQPIGTVPSHALRRASGRGSIV